MVDFQLVAVEVQHVAVSVDPTRTAAETVVVAAHLVETKTDSRVIAVETVVAGSRMVAVVEPLVGCPYALLSFFIQNLAIQANCCHTYRFINYQKKAEGKKGRTGYDVVELRLCFPPIVMIFSVRKGLSLNIQQGQGLLYPGLVVSCVPYDMYITIP